MRRLRHTYCPEQAVEAAPYLYIQTRDVLAGIPLLACCTRHVMRNSPLILAVLLWPTAAVAQAEDCPSPPAVDDISVFVDMPAYSLSHELSIAQLTAQFGDDVRNDMQISGYADIGAAYTEVEYRSVEWRWNDDPPGVGCFALQIGVTFWYEAPIVLYVASDHPQGTSCYSAVLRHEQEHYEITQELAESLGRRLQRALENDLKIAKTWNPLRFYSTAELEQLQHLSTERANRITNGFLRRLNDDMKSQHQQLDSPRSYERTNAQCTN